MPCTLASVGCRVRMLERNPVVAALLDDGTARGYEDAEISGWLPQERLRLIPPQSDGAERYHPRPQVVILTRCSRHKQKSTALVKRDARVSVAGGPDLDADGLLEPARLLATKRRNGSAGLRATAGECRHAKRGNHH
ncbi:hypothetical protein DMH88_02260 [Escherichia coli]|nr:hypothetical protein [Escherichia coli]